MRGRSRVIVSVMGVCLVAGCRASTKVVEEPRVDLHLTEGNRGFLVGTPPPVTGRRTTRQVVEADVELPSSAGKLSKNAAPPATSIHAAPDQPLDVNVGEPSFSSTGPAEQYTVKPGESLWTIAAKPEVYGDGNKWRQLYEANRELLKQPSDLRAGMTLRVPRTGALGQAPEPALSPEEQRFVK